MTITLLAPTSKAVVHASILTSAGRLAVRDAIPDDVDAYVNYWHHSGDEIKNLLGIDHEKLGGPEESYKRFFDMIRVPNTDQANVIFTLTLDDELIGYSNVNRCSVEDNYVHLHTYRSLVRVALRERKLPYNTKSSIRLAAVLLGLIGMYFNVFPVRRLSLMTRTINLWINRALDFYMPPAETKYVLDPPGLAAPSECHLRYVHREDVPWIRKRAEALAVFDRQPGSIRQPVGTLSKETSLVP